MHNRQSKTVYWIGGSSYSGKTSTAKRIAERFGLTLYRTDEHAFGKYMFAIGDEKKYPHIVHYRDLLLGGMDAFFRRSESELLESFLYYCREVFPLLLNDVKSLAQLRPVLVEGAHILLEFIAENGVNSIFLVNTREQQKRIWRLEMEGKIPGGHPGEIENYRRATDKKQIEQWRTSFHHSLAQYIERTAKENALKVIIIDERVEAAAVESMIIEQFQLPD
jgi:uridine kinase